MCMCETQAGHGAMGRVRVFDVLGKSLFISDSAPNLFHTVPHIKTDIGNILIYYMNSG